MYPTTFGRFGPVTVALVALIGASPSFALGQDAVQAPPASRVMSAAPNVSGALGDEAAQLGAAMPGAAQPISATSANNSVSPVSSDEQSRIEATMSAEQRPYPLRFRDLTQNGKFYLQVPELQEIRLMPPGIALDYASRSRQQVSRYVTDAIGIAAQDRARETEAVNSWIDRVIKQKATLAPGDVWLQYAFSQQMYQQLTPYREKVVGQSEPELKAHMQELARTVEHATQIMAAAQGYEQRTAWYNVMVHFKEGLQLIQAQQRSGDAQVLKVIDDFIAENPPVPRPAGDVPAFTPMGNRPALNPTATPTMSSVDIGAVRKPAAAPEEEGKTSGNSFIGTIIGIVMVLGFMAFFLPLRKRMKKKGPEA